MAVNFLSPLYLARAALLAAGLLLGAAGGAGAQAPPFDGRAAMRYLQKQVDFGPRNPGSEGHRACLDWMLSHLRERADRVDPHGFVIEDPYGEGRLTLTNVRAVFNPDAGRRIALAAHWDTRPRADRDSTLAEEVPIPGANDGASGVAVLLALADLLAAQPAPIGVDLLFFDGEDYGREGDLQHYLIGSRRFVRDFPRYRPAALILLDMVGEKGLSIPMEGNSAQVAPELVAQVFQRALQLGLPAFQPVVGPAVLDDHVPFLERGIPAVNLIDIDYEFWHTLEDTPDKCSVDSLEQVGTLVAHLVYVDLAGP